MKPGGWKGAKIYHQQQKVQTVLVAVILSIKWICVKAFPPLSLQVRMAAAEHRHSSGLPHWPYLTAETLKNRMGHQPPPPTQQRSIKDNSLSLKTPPECPLHPLPPSADDNLKTPPECLLTPLPPSAPPSADNLKTPPACALYPPPPSADDNLKTPPECLITPLPP